MSHPDEDYEPDCFAAAKDYEIQRELEDLDQLNRERAEKGLEPLSYLDLP